MNLKDISIAGLIILSLILGWLFLNERNKTELLEKARNKLKTENRKLKVAYLELLEKVLKIENNLTPDVLKELNELKEKAKLLDEKIHLELGSIVELVNAGKGEKAVKDLAKIIENLLKKKVENVDDFKKNPTLHNLLEYANVCKWIRPDELAIGLFLKNLRNEESHELAVAKPKHEVGLALFGGIKVIYSLWK